MSSSDDSSPPLRYRDAGVDIDAGNRLVDRIRPLARRTARPGVLGGLGGFGALFEIPPGRFQEPVLVAATDGVGTKLRLAIDLDRHDTIGIDLVAMCVNDLVVQGAEPLFFLDYLATGRLDVEVATTVIGGIARGCELAGAALIGGETAEMPGMYAEGDYDLAGFAVGAVERRDIIDGSRVSPGDVIIGLASSGPHANGYSLIRCVLERSGRSLAEPLDGESLADRLLAPTRIYVRSILGLRPAVAVHAAAHITGGGLVENVPRVLPEAAAVRIDAGAWPMPAVFRWLQDVGRIETGEMHRTFNCGIGMVLIIPANDADAALSRLADAGERAGVIGEVVPRHPGEPHVVIE